jgi:PAS domain S-box-containing protein
MKYLSEKKITFFYYFAGFLLLAVLSIYYNNNQKVKYTAVLVEHSQEVLATSNNILLDVLKFETGSRGFVLTGNDFFLDPFYTATKTVNSNLASLELLTKDNPNQQVRVGLLKLTVNKKMLLSKQLVEAKINGLLNESVTKSFVENGKLITDKIRVEIDGLNLEELNLLKQRKIENEKSNANGLLIFSIMLLLIVIIITLLIFIRIEQGKTYAEIAAYSETQKLLSNYSLSLIEASLDPLVTINSNGKITDLNEASVNVTGIARNALIGSDFFEYFTEPQKAREVYQEVFSKGFVADSPLTIRHKNGKLTDVLFNGSVYKNEAGKVLGVVIVARDIAEQKWATGLRAANKELAFQNDEKEKRAAELGIANAELAYQNKEKEKRAAELIIANEELALQNKIKEKRAAELSIANTELAYQNDEKEKRAAELSIANMELAYQNDEKEKRAAELSIANMELAYQNDEKEKRAAELSIANMELAYQNDEKEKRATELAIANKELAFQNDEKEKRAAELSIANKELAYQNNEKEKRATELVIANTELDYQNDEKEKRATELVIANTELAFQNDEKEKRASELAIADIELSFQNSEKEKREIANKELMSLGKAAKLAAQYSLSLIEASLDPMFTIDPMGKITDMNNATVKITDEPREKLIGSDFIKYFTEPDKAMIAYQQAFEIGFITDFPLTIIDSKLTDVLLNGSVYTDDAGNVIGVVLVARDVTEQKRIATELSEAIVFAELATEIAENAKVKAEAATLIAEDAVKSKQQFLSNMSHEIRTPMNAIIGFTKVVLKTDLTAKKREYLTAIKMSGDALIVLINDILDLAKVDAGKMVFERIPFKIALSISAMLHLFEPKIEEKNLRLVKEFDSNIPEFLLGDSVRLNQIILNLLSNAIKFTSAGSITASTKLLKEDDEKVTIEFSVSDTGIGIPESKIEKIFENFQQASSGTSRLYGGTGLGLAIVKQLVQSQGGAIQVKSKVGEGSVFSIVLSFFKTKNKPENEVELIELDSSKKNIRVLVVEDIPLNRLLMKTLLDDFGFERDFAENGKIAIEKMESNSYDIILMDLQMPVMNGFEATDYIRNTIKSNIPIIALTADVTTVDLAKCKEVGMNDYIAKPVDERLLYSKIIGLVQKPIAIKSAENIVHTSIENNKLKCTNLDYLIHRTKSNTALMTEMIVLYLEQTPPLIKAMRESLQQNDWNLLAAAVHKIIPSFLIVGISSDYEVIAKKVQEYASTQQHTDELPKLVLQLENICVQACEELKEELNTLKNTL